MPASDDEIFNRELNRAAEFGGILPPGTASRLMVGARFVHKFLPTETYAETLALKIAPEEALKLGFSVLTKLGKPETNDDIKLPRTLKAVVGCGFLGMNPAIVRLEILDGGSGECELWISAAAKEGLIIKQDTASQAVERVVSEFRDITVRT